MQKALVAVTLTALLGAASAAARLSGLTSNLSQVLTSIGSIFVASCERAMPFSSRTSGCLYVFTYKQIWAQNKTAAVGCPDCGR